MTEIDARDLELLALDVFPHVHLGPIADGENAHVFALIQPTIVEIPNFRALILRIPLAKTIAETEEALLGAGLFFIAARPTDAAIEAKLLDRREERGDLQAVATDFPRCGLGDPFRDRLLNRAHDQFAAELLRAAVAEFVELGKMMTGIDVEQRHRQVRRTKRFLREAQETDGVLAPGEEERGPLKFARDLPHNVDSLGFEMLKMVEMVGRHRK